MRLLYVIFHMIICLLAALFGIEKTENKTKPPDVDFRFIPYETEFVLNPLEFPVDINIEELLGEKICDIKTPKKAYHLGQKIIGQMHKNGKLETSELIGIIHFQKNNVWLFEYSNNLKRDPDYISGGFYIAIDGENGKVIAAWTEEG